MKKALLVGIMAILVIFGAVWAFQGCATLQVKPAVAIHEVILYGSGMELTFNAPGTWPSTEEFALGFPKRKHFFRLPGLCVYKTQIGVSYYNILIDLRQEPLEAICLSNCVIVEDIWSWYLFKRGMPVEVSRAVARVFINLAEKRGPVLKQLI